MTRSPERPTDLVDLLDRRASGDGVAVFGRYDRSTASFAIESQQGLIGRAISLGRHLADRGVATGDTVVVSCGTSADAYLGFLAAVTIGAVPTISPVRPAFDATELIRSRLGDILAGFGGDAWVLMDAGRADKVAGVVPDHRRVELPAALDHTDEYTLRRPADPAAPAFYQLTSGSTGKAKPVVVSHENVLANLAAIARRTDLRSTDRLVSWLPLYHDMGLVGFGLLALQGATDLYLLSPYDFLSDPNRWLRAISDVGGTFAASPTFGYELVLDRIAAKDPGPLDLSTWDKAYWGAEPVSFATAARFARAMAPYGMPRHAHRATYGLAEATLCVTMPVPGAELIGLEVAPQAFVPGDEVTVVATRTLGAEIDRADAPATGDAPSGGDPPDVARGGEVPCPVFVTLGPPVDGTTVRLVDGTGRTITGDDRCGEVVITGPGVVAGYRRPDGTVDGPDDGIMHTGDLGFFHRGELVVVDRLKNIVIRNGVNHAVTPIEDTLAALTGISRRRIAVFDSDLRPGHGRVTAVIELPRRRPAREVHLAVVAGLDRFDPPLEELVLVPSGAIPVTTSGKKQHHLTRTRLADGSLKTLERHDLLGARSRDDVAIDLDEVDDLHRVRRLVDKIAATRGFTGVVHDDSDFRHDLGYDSLAFFELVVAIEDELDLAFAEIDLPQIVVVADLLALVERVRRQGVRRAGLLERIDALTESIPQTYRHVEHQQGRELRIDGRWITDFASCNYLGLDLHPDVIEAVAPLVAQWGVHPSWTRAVASPGPYRLLEERLADLVGAPEAIVFPTVTLIHLGVLPVLVGDGGTLLVDREAHHSIQEAAALVRGKGGTVVEFDRHDLVTLDALLARSAGPRVVAVDGVYSMAGSFVDLHALVALAERHDATIYVDDAHGFGILGEDPTAHEPWGRRGNGLVRHLGLGYDRIVYVAGLSKAYSSMAAFVTARDRAERRRFEMSSTMVFSGPVPYASLASALAGLDVNDREGDVVRARLRALSRRLVDGARDLGYEVDNQGAFPIVNVIVGDLDAVQRGCALLWDHGLLITPAVFPAAPLHRGGLRFTLTATNTDAQVDRALAALAELCAATTPAKAPVGAWPSGTTPGSCD